MCSSFPVVVGVLISRHAAVLPSQVYSCSSSPHNGLKIESVSAELPELRELRELPSGTTLSWRRAAATTSGTSYCSTPHLTTGLNQFIKPCGRMISHFRCSYQSIICRASCCFPLLAQRDMISQISDVLGQEFH